MKFIAIFLSLFFTYSVYALAVRQGSLRLVKAELDFCSSGQLQIAQDGELKMLTLGMRISLPYETKTSVEKVADGNCLEEDKSKITEDSVVLVSKIYQCSEKFNKLEGEVTQIIKFNGDKVVYERVSGGETKRCFFERVKK